MISPGKKLRPIFVKTGPWPQLATDNMPIILAVLTKVPGKSIIEETIFSNRFMAMTELKRMGAKIEIHNNTAHIFGPSLLNGAEVMATDLRASVSLVLAALIAEKRTNINRIYHLDRGYQDLEKKLTNCKARITRI